MRNDLSHGQGKGTSLDGCTCTFYQDCWDIVKEDFAEGLL